jgi:hypothetical protein
MLIDRKHAGTLGKQWGDAADDVVLIAPSSYGGRSGRHASRLRFRLRLGFSWTFSAWPGCTCRATFWCANRWRSSVL